MRSLVHRRALAGLLLFLLAGAAARGAEPEMPLRLAVAANFQVTAREIARVFEARTGDSIELSAGSSGALFAQISNGAPFHVFLSADSERPRRLEASGLAVDGSRFTYAIGRLILWSASPAFLGRDCETALRMSEFERLAIANPRTAPYGAAARDVLHHLGLWERLQNRLVVGESVSQALHFVASGSVSLGLIARAQALQPGLPEATCAWLIPDTWHAPIEQQAVELRNPHPAAAPFLAFLRSDEAVRILEAHGYTRPAP